MLWLCDHRGRAGLRWLSAVRELSRGVGGGGGGSHAWDVLLEIRCADSKPHGPWEWGAPSYLYTITFGRHCPYGPLMWRGVDGAWYPTIALDACGGATPDSCQSGSMNKLWRAPSLRGPWTLSGAHFASNRTVWSTDRRVAIGTTSLPHQTFLAPSRAIRGVAGRVSSQQPWSIHDVLPRNAGGGRPALSGRLGD
jgi:hypothetical protein